LTFFQNPEPGCFCPWLVVVCPTNPAFRVPRGPPKTPTPDFNFFERFFADLKKFLPQFFLLNSGFFTHLMLPFPGPTAPKIFPVSPEPPKNTPGVSFFSSKNGAALALILLLGFFP